MTTFRGCLPRGSRHGRHGWRNDPGQVAQGSAGCFRVGQPNLECQSMTLKRAWQTRTSGTCWQPPASSRKPRRRVGADVKTAIHR